MRPRQHRQLSHNSAFAVIGDEVESAKDCIVESHRHVKRPPPAWDGRTSILPGSASFGGRPQDLTYKGGARLLRSRRRKNEFHEFSTVNRGTVERRQAATRLAAATNLIGLKLNTRSDSQIGSHHDFRQNGAKPPAMSPSKDTPPIGAFCPVHSFAESAKYLISHAHTVITRMFPALFLKDRSPRDTKVVWREFRRS